MAWLGRSALIGAFVAVSYVILFFSLFGETPPAEAGAVAMP